MSLQEPEGEGGPGLHELQQNAQYLVLLSIPLSEA